jgi:hypothetical protein
VLVSLLLRLKSATVVPQRLGYTPLHPLHLLHLLHLTAQGSRPTLHSVSSSGNSVMFAGIFERDSAWIFSLAVLRVFIRRGAPSARASFLEQIQSMLHA